MSILQQNPNFHMFRPGWRSRIRLNPGNIPGLPSPILWLEPGHGTYKGEGARLFHASNSEYFSHADDADLSVGDIDFTWAGWVYIDTVGSDRIILHKGTGTSTTNSEYKIFYVTANQKIRFGCGNGVTDAVADTEVVSPQRWYFVVAWHDATNDNVNIQLNDGTAVSTSYTDGSQDTAATLFLGAQIGPANFLPGILSSWGFWKRTLTAAEKTWLYNFGINRTYSEIGVAGTDGSALKTSLMGWWDLDEASGNALDSHTNGLDLTDNNTVSIGEGVNPTNFSANTDEVYLIHDRSPSNNHGRSHDPARRPVLDISSSTLSLNFTSDVVRTSLLSTEIPSNSDYTISVWIKANATTGNQTIVSDWGSGDRSLLLRLNSNQIQYFKGSGTATLSGNAAFAYTSTDWNHIVATHDVSTKTLELFENTVSQNSNTYTGTAGNSTLNIHTGASPLPGDFFNGRIGHVYFYNRILADHEITKIYNYGLPYHT